MATIQIGRVCLKTQGREKGRRCIIADIIDKNFLLITGPPKISGVKRRRVNVKHIQPLEHVIDINRGMSDEEIEDMITQSDLLAELQAS
ncbi:MAG: 50S ribosomal protein L14e [Candidatus Bathyarchaeota archaeon]|jgi:large subunit ribosomal protein L14e|nr:50S ribosomal protein L14e [Candidatus Bathyarchaeota archaeon]